MQKDNLIDINKPLYCEICNNLMLVDIYGLQNIKPAVALTYINYKSKKIELQYININNPFKKTNKYMYITLSNIREYALAFKYTCKNKCLEIMVNGYCDHKKRFLQEDNILFCLETINFADYKTNKDIYYHLNNNKNIVYKFDDDICKALIELDFNKVTSIKEKLKLIQVFK